MIQIYILYNYELYKLTINIYVHKNVSDFFGSMKMFSMTSSKKFVPYFHDHNTNLYNKFEFLENYSIYSF